ncbi:MAG: hypothetical protein QXK11_08095 [Pyrobaculum sp.]
MVTILAPCVSPTPLMLMPTPPRRTCCCAGAAHAPESSCKCKEEGFTNSYTVVKTFDITVARPITASLTNFFGAATVPIEVIAEHTYANWGNNGGVSGYGYSVKIRT